MNKQILTFFLLAFCAFPATADDDNISVLIAGFRDARCTRNDFKKVEDIKNYVDEHTGINGLQLVHHTGYPKRFSLQFLNDHPQIKHLDLGGMAPDPTIFDLRELTHITSLSIHVANGFGKCCKPEWTQNCYVPGLEELYTSMEHFAFLGEMPKLSVLSLQPCWYSRGVKFDLKGIERYPLKKLNISLDAVEYTRCLEALVDLEELTINGHDLKAKDFNFIRKLRNLKKLKIYNTCEIDFDVLYSLPELEDIHFDFHGQKNLEVLGTLPKLRRLHLGDYKLSSLSFLMGCKSLEDFSCGFCAVTSIEALRGLPLKRLILNSTKVKDLRPIRDIPTLEILNISCNYPHYWEGLRDHPSLRRINGHKQDLIMPTDMMSWKEMENLTLDQDTWELDAKAQQYLVYRKKSMPTLTDSSILDILATIPKLELINTGTRDYPEDVLNQFKRVRPDVDIAEYSDWEKAILPK